MIRLSCIGCALILFWPTVVSAQQQIGFVDTDRILEKMPEYEGIEQRLSLLSDAWQEELDRMEQELESLEAEYEAREILYTEEVRQDRLQEIESLRREREAFLEDKFGPDGEYFLQQKELLEPLQRQVFEAVRQVAREEGYDFIFDRESDIRFLYAEPEWNVTERVIEVLGLESPDETD